MEKIQKIKLRCSVCNQWTGTYIYMNVYKPFGYITPETCLPCKIKKNFKEPEKKKYDDFHTLEEVKDYFKIENLKNNPKYKNFSSNTLQSIQDWAIQSWVKSHS